MTDPSATSSAPTATAAPAASSAASTSGGPETAALPDPETEAARAIEETRAALRDAIAALESGDDDRQAHAYERAAECADHVARALWFLHRIERGRSATAGAASA